MIRAAWRGVAPFIKPSAIMPYDILALGATGTRIVGTATAVVTEANYDYARFHREIYYQVSQFSPATFRSDPVHVRHRWALAREARTAEERAKAW